MVKVDNNHSAYRKVASSRLSWLVAHHLMIFRLFMKGNVDAYYIL